MGNTAFRDQYPCLYKVNRPKHVTIAEVLSTSPPNLISWHMDLIGSKLVAWNNMLPCIPNLTLGHESDVFYWKLTPNEQFSVKPNHEAIIHLQVPNLNKRLEKMKASLKVKVIFMVFVVST